MDLLAAYRKSLADQGVADDRDDYFIVTEVLGPLAQQNPELFELDPGFAEKFRAIREANAPGTLRGIANTARSAFDRSRQALNAIGGVDAEDVAAVERDIQARTASVPWEDWQRTEGMEAAKAFLRDPIEITANIIAAGLAGSLPAIGGGLSGGLAGAAAGGPGAPVTGTIGAMAGTAAGSLAVEYGNKFLEVLREAGADLTNPDSIRATLADPEVAWRARELGLRRGIPVAAFDAASAGLAGKFLKGLRTAGPRTTGQMVRVGAAEAGTQGALGGAGEVAGALSAGEEVKPGAVFEEIVGELGPGLAEVGGAAARRGFQNPFRAEPRSPFLPAAPGAPTGAPTDLPDSGSRLVEPTTVAPGSNLIPGTPAVEPAAVRSSAEIVRAVEQMDDATAAARHAELMAKAARTPEEETEMQLLMARLPARESPPAPGAAPVLPTSAPASVVPVDVGPTVAEVGAVQPPAVEPAPVRQPESTYRYTISRPQMEGDPGYIQIDEIADGQGRGSFTLEQLQARGVALPSPPDWLPTGQYTLEQVTEAIASGDPNAQRPTLNAQLSSDGPAAAESGAPPKIVAPEVATQPDLPKPAEIPPVVASTAPEPAEVAAVKAVEAKPQGFSFGAIIEGDPTMDFRDFEPIKPTDWERAIRANLRHPLAARGDKTGARSTTRVAMAVQLPGSEEIVLAGVVQPQRLLRVGGGTEIDGIALQQMGRGAKAREYAVGGDQPVLLREVLATGARPIAVVHFAGEPTRIFQRFGTLAEFDAAYGATPKQTGRRGDGETRRLPVTPTAVGEVRNAARGEREIQAEIDRLGAEYQKADPATQERLSLEIVRLFDELNDVLRKGQNQTGDVALRTTGQPDDGTTGLARAPVLADRTQQFIAVVDRLRRQGADVQVFTQEFFRQGVRTEVERRIATLNAQRATLNAQGRSTEAVDRAIAALTERLAAVDQAAGAAYGPWHLALALDDVQNARVDNLVTLLHEAAEALASGLNPAVKGRMARAIQASLDELRAQSRESSARSGAPLARESGDFDLLAETLAQKLAAEGVPDAPSLAQAIWRWVKDLYYRTAMAAQRAFGAEPSDELALDWFENQLRRVVGGDYDYRIARLLDRYLPEPMAERIRRLPGRTGTPGGVVDYWNPYGTTERIEQPTVLPATMEGVEWNVEFRTLGPQRAGGEEIPGPEARVRIEAAALNRLIQSMEEVRGQMPEATPWAEWWGAVGTGDDPRVMLATIAQRLPGAETAQIGGARMTQVMSDLAALEARRMLENIQLRAVQRAAKATEEIETESDRVIAAAKEVNRLEADRRNAQLQEATLQDKLKGLVRRFVKDNSDGFRLAEQQGELAEAVRAAEGLIESDPVPEQYQQVFKAVLDGQVPVFDYVRAIAELDLPISEMTQREVLKAIRDNAEANEALGRLARNRPLAVALSVLARKNAGQLDEIHLGWLRDAEAYRAIHEELQGIRQANDEQLRQMIATMDERVEAGTLRDRLKREYLKRRRALRTARDRVAAAQQRVDAIQAALPAIGAAVEQAQQSGSTAPSEWAPVEGAAFTEMVPGEGNAPWTRRSHTLRFRADGSAVDGEALRKAVWNNNAWLKANAAKRGSALYERVRRETTELAMLDAQAQYAVAQSFKIDTYLAPLVAEARQLGGAGSRVAQMMQFFDHVRFVHRQQVDINARGWSRAWNRVKKTSGIADEGVLSEQVYDPINYFLNTEPGLDEEAALRQAVRMARARLPGTPAEGFNAAVEDLLRASKTGFEYLLSVAEQSGSFVKDPRLKSELRRAVAQGWLTSMRSVDGGLVMRIVRDMEKAGWKLRLRQAKDERGRDRIEDVRGVTFADLTPAETANTEALSAALQQLFPAGVVRDWLLPFINKGGVEVFKGPDGEAIPQLVLQNAWATAGRQDNGTTGQRVLAWIDQVGADVGLPLPEPTKDGPPTDPVADFRLSMLRQLDALFGMEAKVVYEAAQTRNMFDPMGPKPHVMMDARLNDTLPPEHLNFARLDPHTSQVLLAEIAFHGAFGRNGERMVQTLTEMRMRAEAAKVEYEALQGTTKNNRVAEAATRGWNYAELERTAQRAGDVQRFQSKLEAFMSVGHPGGPFDGLRSGMALLNFMAGQIVDNPKTAFYNLLSLAQTPFAMRSLGPKSLRAVSDAFVTTAKTGLGSLLEALHLNLMHASAEEAEIAATLGAGRRLPWELALADAGTGTPQTLSERVLIRPLNFIRYVQNKGVGLPLQGAAKEFPRLAVVPGLGVANSIAQIAAVGGMSAQVRMLKRMIARGIEYYASHRDAAQDPGFRFHARDLGLGRADQGIFDWWRVKAVEYGLGTLEDLVRAAIPAATKGERLLSRDQVLRVAQMVATEINGDSSVNTTPSLLVTNPFLRVAFPLLRWPFWAMHKTHEGLRTVDGQRNYASVMKGLGILAMWNLPIGLAFTFLLDRYDEELLGKKSNLPGVGGVAALPFVGPVAEAIMADRSIPDTLKAYLVRSARAGNIYGLGSDLMGQIAAPTDAASGRRTFSLDQRVLVMSQLLNMQQAISNAAGQEWTTTWSSVWHPLFRSVGGNGALHVLDVANKVLGLDNAESRGVMRVNAGNWLRAAASELEIELRPGGSGTPTPMSVWTRSMLEAAMANDRIGFLEAHRKALEAARKVVATDPAVKPQEREAEAERRVLAGWRGRDPLTIFARRPSEAEVRRLLAIMDPDGAQDVREALNRYQQFTRLIAVSPAEQQQRALVKRLTSPPALTNPFRRQMGSPLVRY